LEHIEASLDTNRQNNKSIILKAVVIKRLGQNARAETILKDLMKTDALDQWAKFELASLTGDYNDFIESSRNDAQTIIDIAFDYAEAGFYSEAIQLIERHQNTSIPECVMPNPMQSSVMTTFMLAWLHDKIGDLSKSQSVLQKTTSSSLDYFFPSRISEQLVLEWVIGKQVKNDVAAYGLGNYYYNMKRHQDAIGTWELAADHNCKYGTLYRNLGIAYWNTNGDGEKARAAYQKAVELSPDDMRIQYEFDQLRKKLNDSPTERLANIELLQDQVLTRDDFSVELAALYNFSGQFTKALEILENKKFHPWEGGEGQVLRQYSYSCLKLGQVALQNGDAYVALEFFRKSFDTPDNLGEKYHPLQAIAHINYWKGMALKALGKTDKANEHFMKSMNEEGDFVDMAVSAYSELSYYKALALKELGQIDEANKLLLNIKKYAEHKLTEEARIDYFATSLPLLLVFEEDMQKRNEWEAKYLLALAELGIGDHRLALNLFNEILQINAMHIDVNDILRSEIFVKKSLC